MRILSAAFVVACHAFAGAFHSYSVCGALFFVGARRSAAMGEEEDFPLGPAGTAGLSPPLLNANCVQCFSSLGRLGVAQLLWTALLLAMWDPEVGLMSENKHNILQAPQLTKCCFIGNRWIGGSRGEVFGDFPLLDDRESPALDSGPLTCLPCKPQRLDQRQSTNTRSFRHLS